MKSRLCIAFAAGVLALIVLPAVSSASVTGALWATQRDTTASHNVVEFGLLDGSDDALTAPIFAGAADTGSYGIAVTPNDRYVYVTNDNGGNSLSQYSVDPITGDLTPLSPATVAVSTSSGADPETVAIDPTGSWAFTANPNTHTVSVLRINPQTGQLTLVDEVDPGSELADPTGVAVSPDGSHLYVTDFGEAMIAQFDINLTSGDLTPMSPAEVSVPGSTPAPIRIITTSDGYAYVTDPGDGAIVQYTIDGSGGLTDPTATTSTDSSPFGLAADTTTTPESLFVAAGNEVDEYTIGAGGAIVPNSFTDKIADGETSSGLAVAPDGNELYVGNDGSGDTHIAIYSVNGNGTLGADETVSAGSEPATPLAANLPEAPTPLTPVGGALTQLASPNDCITSDAFGCNTLISGSNNSLDDSYQPVVSGDGKNVYDVSLQGDLDEFSRDPSTGALTYMGCVTSAASGCATGGGIENVDGMAGPQGMALSPDGTSAYVVTSGDHALVTFSRAPSTGVLSSPSCVSSSGASGCAVGHALDNPYGVAVSPDGDNVYTTSNTDAAISDYQRASNGALTFENCMTTGPSDPPCTDTSSGDLAAALSVVVSPDGNNVYVASGGLGPGGDVVEFSRTPGTGALVQLTGAASCITTGTADYPNCGTTSAIGFDGGSEDLVVSPDGKNVYVNAFGDNGVIELSRDASTGALTQLPVPNACLAEETSASGFPFSCTQPPYPQQNGTAGALGVAVSPDGLDVYVSGAEDNAVASFSRDPQTGALTPIALPFGCITGGSEGQAGTCPQYNTNGLYGPRRLTVSPDGENVYVADQQGEDVVGGDGVVELARHLPADLALSETGAPASATVGGQITYAYTVTNGGPAAAGGPTLSVPLAAELTLVSATTSQGSCSGVTTVTCSLGALADGVSATVHVTVTLASTGRASVSASVADVLDTNTYNNSVTTSTTINAPVKAPSAPPAGPAIAPPVLEQSTDVQPVTGSVFVKLPGSSSFVSLSSAENIPMGSTIDATNGTVAITVALPNGTTETGDFYDGEFVVTQDATGRVFETLTGGSFVGCPVSGKAQKHKKGKKGTKGALEVASAKKKSSTVVRQLWGNAHGDFTTKGRYGSAAVSGTIWLTQDRCDGTYFKVTKDTIVVVAFAKPGKKHNLKQGQSILVPKP